MRVHLFAQRMGQYVSLPGDKTLVSILGGDCGFGVDGLDDLLLVGGVVGRHIGLLRIVY